MVRSVSKSSLCQPVTCYQVCYHVVPQDKTGTSHLSNLDTEDDKSHRAWRVAVPTCSLQGGSEAWQSEARDKQSYVLLSKGLGWGEGHSCSQTPPCLLNLGPSWCSPDMKTGLATMGLSLSTAGPAFLVQSSLCDSHPPRPQSKKGRRTIVGRR